MISRSLRLMTFAAAIVAFAASPTRAEDKKIHSFDRVKLLDDAYYSEGATAGDLNNDGVADATYGPYWFEGPDFTKKHELYKPKPWPMDKGWSNDNFFNWVYDFNGDGWNDILVVGIPATPAVIYENPGKDGLDKHWPKHEVLDRVTNESPQWISIVGDERPELICTNHRYYGYATWDAKNPFAKWKFHPVSDDSAPERFGHGLGVGDINGDGKLDIIQAGGWYEQPQDNPNTRWKFHNVKFTPAYGGADMFAYDVDADGKNDVVTSLAAHDSGLGWYKQIDPDTFELKLIMGEEPEENRYGLNFTELHALGLVDMDGDGLKDIVTGKTYWSHHRQNKQWNAGAVVYWFKLVRGKDGSIDWVPYLADGDAGIGRQITIADVNQDGLPDIVVGGMKGGSVLVHKTKDVDAATWEAAQPKVKFPKK